MSFYRFFKLIAIATALMVGVSSAAKNAFGNITYVAGGNQAEHKKKNKDWKQAKFKDKVYQHDDLRTGDEAQIKIQLPDGSAITINERTLVSMAELMNENGINQTLVDIKNGKVNFDAQKQANGSNFKFKTGTATAAIRGTAGVVGKSSKSKMIVSLHNGEVKFTDEVTNKSAMVKGGQTAFLYKDSIVTLDLPSSGDPAVYNIIDTLLNDTTKSIDEVIDAVKNSEKQYRDYMDELRQSIQCSIAPLPDTVYEATQTVKATCTVGTLVGIYEAPIRAEGEVLELTVNWAPSLVGQKKIPLTCYIDGTHGFPCGQVNTYYAGSAGKSDSKPEPLTITSGSTMEVCNSSNITIEGTFDSTDTQATLYIQLGNYKSDELVHVSVGGHFSHTIQVSDKQGNWNATKAFVYYKSKKNGDQKKEIDLVINKSCKAINLIFPLIEVSKNECQANISVNNIDGDNAIFSYFVDEQPQKERYVESKTSFPIKLKKGVHNYRFVIEDLAGNSKEIQKEYACFSNLKNPRIKLSKGRKERLRVPPPPSGISNIIYRQLSFTVKGLPPGNDPRYIKEVKIVQDEKEIANLKTTDLQSNTITQEIQLSRGKTSTIDITVTLMSNQILHATKTYEVH